MTNQTIEPLALTVAVLPVEFATTDAGALTMTGTPELGVTVLVAVAVQVPPPLTVTEYVVVDDGETVIDVVVAPVDQRYDEMPDPVAVSVIGEPQLDDGPVIVTVGDGEIVTATGEDVAEHPDPSVTVTV